MMTSVTAPMTPKQCNLCYVISAKPMGISHFELPACIMFEQFAIVHLADKAEPLNISLHKEQENRQ